MPLQVHPFGRLPRSLRATLALAAVPALVASAPAAASDDAVCRAGFAGPDPFAIELYPTAHANGATGEARLRFASSPFGVAVTDDGAHLYHMEMRTERLPRHRGALVVWIATPELDRVQKLGTIGEDGRIAGRVDFNKFLVFVTAEPSPDVDRWSGPILLRGISRSGRMHTMAGHGPFEGEPCGQIWMR